MNDPAHPQPGFDLRPCVWGRIHGSGGAELPEGVAQLFALVDQAEAELHEHVVIILMQLNLAQFK